MSHIKLLDPTFSWWCVFLMYDKHILWLYRKKHKDNFHPNQSRTSPLLQLCKTRCNFPNHPLNFVIIIIDLDILSMNVVPWNFIANSMINVDILRIVVGWRMKEQMAILQAKSAEEIKTMGKLSLELIFLKLLMKRRKRTRIIFRDFRFNIFNK